MSYFAVTTLQPSTPTAATGSVTVPCADPSVLPTVPFYATIRKQGRDDLSGVTRARSSHRVLVTAVSGRNLTATLNQQGTTCPAAGIEAGDILDASGYEQFGGGTDVYNYPAATHVNILDGNLLAPITVAQPTYKIIRTELINPASHNLDPGYNAALNVSVASISGNQNQSQAIFGRAHGYAAAGNFVIGGYFEAKHEAGPGAGLGVFAVAETDVVGAGAQAIATIAFNGTGADQPYSANPGNSIVGIELYYAGTGNHYGGAASQIRASAGLGTFDVGYAALAASVRSAAFRDDSNAISSVVVNGAHTTIINGSGATASSFAFDLRGTNTLAASGASGVGLLYDQTAQAAGQGARLVLGGKYTDAGAYAEFAAIGGIKANSTTGNFAGQLGFYTRANGGSAWTLGGYFDSDGSLVIGSPTGGAKGPGTINATAVYDDNSLLTDYVFEDAYELMPIREMYSFAMKEKHLPTIPGGWGEEDRPSVGKLQQHLYETVEVQSRYIGELEERVHSLEALLVP